MIYKVDGHRASKPWWVVLTHLRRMGVSFHVNDGRRTVAMQRQRIRDHGRWSPSNPTGAAAAVPWAPHIKNGRANHAVDMDGAESVVAYLRHHGAPSAVRPVPGEPWHVEVGRRDLLRLARRIEKARRA